jgi:hypothetical protein
VNLAVTTSPGTNVQSLKKEFKEDHEHTSGNFLWKGDGLRHRVFPWSNGALYSCVVVATTCIQLSNEELVEHSIHRRTPLRRHQIASEGV